MSERKSTFQRERPSHASQYLAELEIYSPRQGTEIFDRFPIDLGVNLGQVTYSDPDSNFQFTMEFRQVIISLALDGCELSSTDRYEKTLDPEIFRNYVVEKYSSKKSSTKKGSAGIGLTIPDILECVGVNANASGVILKELEDGKTTTLETVKPIKTVRYMPGQRWEIGHTLLGDPAEHDGKLRGRYLDDPADGKTDEDYSPICYVLPLSKMEVFEVVIELRARKIDCIYTSKNKSKEYDQLGWNKKKIEKILALKMLEEENRQDGLDPPEGEVILARGSITVLLKDEEAKNDIK